MALSPQEKIVIVAIIQKNLTYYRVIELKSLEAFLTARNDILAILEASYNSGHFDSRSDYMEAVRLVDSLGFNESIEKPYPSITGNNDYKAYSHVTANEQMTHKQEVINTYNGINFVIKSATNISGITNHLGDIREFSKQPLGESLFTTDTITTDNPDVLLHIATAISTLQYRVSNWRTEWILGALKIEKRRIK